jgi:hypothetical protein
MKFGLILTAALLLIPAQALASGRIVQCAITSGGVVEFKGKCKFLPEAGGSFTLLDAAGKDTFYGSIGMVSVYVTGKDTAEVSGLVLGGNNSRWGSAKRSNKDRACWEGSDFRICAW